MYGRLIKVYCYRGSDKQIWFEVEDIESQQGIAWSPSRVTAVRKAKKMGYEVIGQEHLLIKFYRAQAS